MNFAHRLRYFYIFYSKDYIKVGSYFSRCLRVKTLVIIEYR